METYREPEGMAALSAEEELAALRAQVAALKAAKATGEGKVKVGSLGLPRISGRALLDRDGYYDAHGVKVFLPAGKYYVGDVARAWPPLAKCEHTRCGAPRTSNDLFQDEYGGLVFVSCGEHSAECTYGDYVAAYPAGHLVGGALRSAALTFTPWTPEQA